jgi:hypothetical protein
MVLVTMSLRPTLRRPSRAQPLIEHLSGGSRPRLIYDAAAAAKTTLIDNAES